MNRFERADAYHKKGFNCCQSVVAAFSDLLEMGEQGEWALVGSRSPQYLWILSRTPTLPDATVDYIVGQAAKRGYNVKNLIFDR